MVKAKTQMPLIYITFHPLFCIFRLNALHSGTDIQIAKNQILANIQIIPILYKFFV